MASEDVSILLKAYNEATPAIDAVTEQLHLMDKAADRLAQKSASMTPGRINVQSFLAQRAGLMPSEQELGGAVAGAGKPGSMQDMIADMATMVAGAFSLQSALRAGISLMDVSRGLENRTFAEARGDLVGALEAQMKINTGVAEMARALPVVGRAAYSFMEAFMDNEGLRSTVALLKEAEAATKAGAASAISWANQVRLAELHAAGAAPSAVAAEQAKIAEETRSRELSVQKQDVIVRMNKLNEERAKAEGEARRGMQMTQLRTLSLLPLSALGEGVERAEIERRIGKGQLDAWKEVQKEIDKEQAGIRQKESDADRLAVAAKKDMENMAREERKKALNTQLAEEDKVWEETVRGDSEATLRRQEAQRAITAYTETETERRKRLVEEEAKHALDMAIKYGWSTTAIKAAEAKKLSDILKPGGTEPGGLAPYESRMMHGAPGADATTSLLKEQIARAQIALDEMRKQTGLLSRIFQGYTRSSIAIGEIR